MAAVVVSHALVATAVMMAAKAKAVPAVKVAMMAAQATTVAPETSSADLGKRTRHTEAVSTGTRVRVRHGFESGKHTFRSNMKVANAWNSRRPATWHGAKTGGCCAACARIVACFLGHSLLKQHSTIRHFSTIAADWRVAELAEQVYARVKGVRLDVGKE